MEHTTQPSPHHPCSDTRVLYERRCAAHQLSISTRTLDRLIGTKQLSARRVGKRILIPHAELMKFSRKDAPNI
jgi:excisionase family DNA binding protein